MTFIKNIIEAFGFSIKSLKLIIWYLLGKIDTEIATHWLTDWNVFYEYGYYEDEDNRREYFERKQYYDNKKKRVNHR